MSLPLINSISLSELTLSSSDKVDATISSKFQEIVSRSSEEGSLVDIEECFLNFVGSVVHGNLTAHQAAQLLQSLERLGNSSHETTALADSIWFWGSQLAKGDPGREKLCGLIREVVQSFPAVAVLLKASLDFGLLQEVKIINDATAQKGRLTKSRTALLWKQQKYNLLREETEGFSKLAVLLGSLPEFPEDPSRSLQQVRALIGHFELDPNRALDVVLDAFEQHVSNLNYLKVLQLFPRKNIPHILGFKFEQYHLPKSAEGAGDGSSSDAKTGAAVPAVATSGAAATAAAQLPFRVSNGADTPAVSGSAPSSLYAVAGILLATKMMVLNDLLPYLSPTPEESGVQASKVEEVMRQQVRTHGVVSLGGSSANTASASNTTTATPAARGALGGHASNPIDDNRGGRGGAGRDGGRSQPPPPPGAPPAGTGSQGGPHPPPYPPPGVPVGKLAPPPPPGAPPSVLSGNKGADSPRGGAAAAATSLPPPAPVSDPYADGNQLVGIAAALLHLRCWALAKTVIDLLTKFDVDIMRFKDARDAMIELITWSTEDVYHPYSLKRLCLTGKNKKLTASIGFINTISSTSSSSTSNTAGSSGSSSSLLLPLAGGGSHRVGGGAASKDSSNGRKTDSTYPTAAAIVIVDGVEDIKRLLVIISEAQNIDGPHKGILAQQLKPFKDILTLPTDILPLANLLSHHLSHSPVLFTRFCRLLTATLKHFVAKNNTSDSNGNGSNNDEAASAIAAVVNAVPVSSDKETDVAKQQALAADLRPAVSLLTSIVLPAMSASSNNVNLTAQVWQIISQLPFQVRYAIYDVWRGSGLAKEALGGAKKTEVVYAECKAQQGARYHLKRLAKENTKEIGKNLALYANMNPLVVYSTVLNQIEAFDNLIPFVVDALKYATDLQRDVMACCLVNQLCKDNEKLKKGDTHYSQWFSALAKFTATYFRKYMDTDITGLLHFLLRRLQAGQSLDLLVLKELLGRMGGCETLLEASPDQLEGLKGGPALRAEAIGSFVKEANDKRAQKTLRDQLMKSGTALPMLLFIAQIRSQILYCMKTSQLKLISHLFDTCQDVLMQFTDFLVAGGPRAVEMVASLMPPMKTLLEEIGLAVPVAFQLVRPLVRLALQSGEDPANAPPLVRCWHPFGPEMLEAIKNHIPGELWGYLSPELYLLFWSLSLYDLGAPSARYAAEIKRLRDRNSALDAAAAAAPVGGAPGGAKLTAKQRSAEKTRILGVITALTNEMDEQERHVAKVTEMIRVRKDGFFVATGELNGLILSNVLQYCVLDRVVMSPLDAVFCTQFFFVLHELNTASFSTVSLIHKMVVSVTPMIFCSTEAEAGFLGYAFYDLFLTLNKWYRMEEKAYLAYATNLLGFSSRINDPNSVMAHKVLALIYWAMHAKLSLVVMNGLKSDEYIHKRSAMIFLSKIAMEFPTGATSGKQLLAQIETVEKEATDKADLQLLAKSLTIILSRQRATWFDDEKKTPTNVKQQLLQQLQLQDKNRDTNKGTSKETPDSDKKSSMGDGAVTAATAAGGGGSSTSVAAGTAGGGGDKSKLGEGVKREPLSSSHDDRKDKDNKERDSSRRAASGAATTSTASAANANANAVSSGRGSSRDRDRRDAPRGSVAAAAGSSGGKTTSTSAAATVTATVGSGLNSGNNNRRDDRRNSTGTGTSTSTTGGAGSSTSGGAAGGSSNISSKYDRSSKENSTTGSSSNKDSKDADKQGGAGSAAAAASSVGQKRKADGSPAPPSTSVSGGGSGSGNSGGKEKEKEAVKTTGKRPRDDEKERGGGVAAGGATTAERRDDRGTTARDRDRGGVAPPAPPRDAPRGGPGPAAGAGGAAESGKRTTDSRGEGPPRDRAAAASQIAGQGQSAQSSRGDSRRDSSRDRGGRDSAAPSIPPLPKDRSSRDSAAPSIPPLPKERVADLRTQGGGGGGPQDQQGSGGGSSRGGPPSARGDGGGRGGGGSNNGGRNRNGGGGPDTSNSAAGGRGGGGPRGGAAAAAGGGSGSGSGRSGQDLRETVQQGRDAGYRGDGPGPRDGGHGPQFNGGGGGGGNNKRARRG